MEQLRAGGLENRAIRSILDGLSRTSHRDSYVLKGGYALHAAYGSPRRSFDLDLNAASPTANEVSEETNRRLLQFCLDLNQGLQQVCSPESFVSLYTVNEQLSRELPILLGEVSYQTSNGDAGRVKMQVMLSETICESAMRDLGGTSIHVASLEDILSEKLKALVQQVTRSAVRSIDVFDLWYFTTSTRYEPDPAKMTHFLLEKCKQWNLPALTKRLFRDEALIAISESAFEGVGLQLADGTELPAFSEAYGGLLEVVDRLELPD